MITCKKISLIYTYVNRYKLYGCTDQFNQMIRLSAELHKTSEIEDKLEKQFILNTINIFNKPSKNVYVLYGDGVNLMCYIQV